ncbi:MAG TPA: NADH-quinone oxidoreductase subunit A [Candidatus Stackebrandtia excrementipullorum]|nr:NADH-quinone oxidoreductase subunit A [Candidatus Stackebrandtia excrementipullorum]
MELYAPVVVLFAIGLAFAVISVLAARLTGPARFNRAKNEAYECGIEATPAPPGGNRFPVKFYLTAMLFIVFDIEIMFLLPWAVHFDYLGLFGFFSMLIFVGTLFIAYIYEWRRGGLDWD